MRPPLRVAILECDTPLENANAKYGGYGGVFTALLRASAKALGQPDKLDPETGLEISKWDVVNGEEYPNLEDIDAILMTGSSVSPSFFPFYDQSRPRNHSPQAGCVVEHVCCTCTVPVMLLANSSPEFRTQLLRRYPMDKQTG